MDYEKKYKEAMNKILSYETDEFNRVNVCPQDIFPELRESEDERIIRAIIDALYSHTNSINLLSSRGYQMENIEAWLEKQKYDRMKPVYDNQDSFESALEKAWKDYNDSGARTVDGCEDNYVECAHAKGFREGYLFGIEKQKEQKPAEWSEEDADMLNCCISSIEEAKENRYAYKETDGDTSYDREIDWLKDLHPSWKPSDDQMNRLCAVVDAAIRKHNESVSGYEPARVLKSLYEDLKKLLYGSTEKVIHKARED